MIAIIGGVYREIVVKPDWDEVYGSGGRAAVAINKLGGNVLLKSHCGAVCKESIEAMAHHEGFDVDIKQINSDVIFKYNHGLATPSVNRDIDSDLCLEIESNNVLCFGMLESTFKISAKKAVYDPQSTINAISFRSTQSKVDELAIILNFEEAISLTNSLEPCSAHELVKAVFESESANIVVLKMGPCGAIVYDGIILTEISSYETDSVWKIGSGDVFSATFSYAWMEQGWSSVEAAELASRAVSFYCNSRFFATLSQLNKYKPAKCKFSQVRLSEVSVYIASPLFTLAQLWLINEVSDCLKSMGVSVFSPYHDVGVGSSVDIAVKDIEGLKKSDIVFAVGDGFDVGTIFEVGYARALGKPVVFYIEEENSKDILMIEGGGSVVAHDFVTAIYKVIWEAISI